MRCGLFAAAGARRTADSRLTDGLARPFLNKMPATIWLMAALSYWTFAHRLFHTWWQIREIDRQELASASETAKAQESPPLRLGHDPV